MLANSHASGASGGDVPTGSPSAGVDSAAGFGDPEEKLREQMEQALAGTFLHAVKINEELKESRQQTQRAMELGSMMKEEGRKLQDTCVQLTAEKGELQSHAAVLAAQASTHAAAAVHATSQAHAAEMTLAEA